MSKVSREMVKIHTEDKRAWCAHGEGKELAFVERVAPLCRMDAHINPEKKANPYAHDLVVNGVPADLKTVNTPFYNAGNYGFKPWETVTFNHKDYLRYMMKYPDLWVIFWVDWPESEEFGVKVKERFGIWTESIERIDYLITRRRTAFHAYQRRREDRKGNAKGSHLISVNDLYCRGPRDGKF